MEKPSKQQVLAGLMTGGLLTAVIVGTLVHDHVVSLPFGLFLAAGGMAGAWIGPRVVTRQILIAGLLAAPLTAAVNASAAPSACPPAGPLDAFVRVAQPIPWEVGITEIRHMGDVLVGFNSALISRGDEARGIAVFMIADDTTTYLISSAEREILRAPTDEWLSHNGQGHGHLGAAIGSAIGVGAWGGWMSGVSIVDGAVAGSALGGVAGGVSAAGGLEVIGILGAEGAALGDTFDHLSQLTDEYGLVGFSMSFLIDWFTTLDTYGALDTSDWGSDDPYDQPEDQDDNADEGQDTSDQNGGGDTEPEGDPADLETCPTAPYTVRIPTEWLEDPREGTVTVTDEELTPMTCADPPSCPEGQEVDLDTCTCVPSPPAHEAPQPAQ